MPEILKANGLVIRKVNYGDTSSIVTFFTDKYGKISGIKKGARSARTKSGNILDYLNLVQIVFYKKESREVQLISQVSLIKHFPLIKNDLERYKYALAILELLEHFTVEEENHEKLYRGTIKILDLINIERNDPLLFFTKFFIFFLKEIGYDLTFSECALCGRKIVSGPVGYKFDTGVICEKCMQNVSLSFLFSRELFELFESLKRKGEVKKYAKEQLNRLVGFFEKFLMYTHHEFKGLNSLRIY
jgi:DNA repair protein RecO (recombination protein O)